MAFCGKCGAQVPDGVKFCTSCGNPMGQQTMNQQQYSQQQNYQQQYNQQNYYKTNNVFDTPDHTAEYNTMDVEQNKVMALLSYLGILWLIPMFAAKQSPFTRFHVKQGFLLAVCGLADCILSTVFAILTAFVPVAGILFSLITGLIGLVIFVMSILGIINAAQGRAKELPFIGKIALSFNFLN